MEIKAKGGTFLKRRPVQSSLLNDSERHFVPSGKQYTVKDLGRKEQNHKLFELITPINGLFNWWVFVPHWDLDDEINCQEINWHEPNAKVSQYFTVNEVTMGDPRRIPRTNEIKNNIIALATELDRVRVRWGSPILVTSWYRPEPINRQVGGVRNSAHTFGHAADICPANGDSLAFERWLDGFWGDRALGYGQAANRGFTHVDLRPGRIRWDY